MTDKNDQMKEKNGNHINLITISGIKINLDYSWFIIFFLVFWSLTFGYFPRYYPGQSTLIYLLTGALATFFFFLSIIIHELSHSLIALRAGINISEITLFIFGGIANITEEPNDPKTELKIAIAGPLSSFVIAAIFWSINGFFASSIHVMLFALFNYLGWINIALGIFNLVPAFPLDGGRIFRALLWWKSHSLNQATKIASNIGQGFALVLVFLGILDIIQGVFIGGLWLIFIGLFLRMIAQGGYQQLLIKQSLEGVKVKDVMIRDVIQVPSGITIDDLINNYFFHYSYRGFPVADDDELLGVITLSDLKNIPYEEQKKKTVKDIMKPLIKSCLVSPDTTLMYILKKMYAEKRNSFFVMQEAKLVGMISKGSLLRFMEIKGFNR
ncbi:MAG: peptidase M50 [Candidatus Margulisiibacteriota bacterium]|nr:MAG: peptidase M50 [Candidatus Margulisiibacteriota bacterium]HCT85350.1 peptidase M50 [Candidatus Margulisiibacteriota bacterium]HCY36595.1 peptidase M50 [Candidatus Margulisiibacteriota bacterium]